MANINGVQMSIELTRCPSCLAVFPVGGTCKMCGQLDSLSRENDKLYGRIRRLETELEETKDNVSLWMKLHGELRRELVEVLRQNRLLKDMLAKS